MYSSLQLQVQQLQQELGATQQELGAVRQQLWAAQERHQDELRQLLEDWACCPITQEVLRDPVCAMDGHCFERAAIETWMAQHAGRVPSPASNLPLPSRQLVPNHALRAVVERLQQLLDEPEGAA